MKSTEIRAILLLVSVTLSATSLRAQIAPEIELGAAGPNGLAVLDYGNFSISFNPATATINGQQVLEGAVNGNLSDYAGNVSTSTSGQLNGTVFLGSGASGVSGANVKTGSTVPGSDLTTAFGSGFGTSAAYASGGAAKYYDGFAPGFTSAPSAGTVAAGVYDLSSWSVSGGTYKLTAGQVYVFNITGDFSLNQAAQFLDATPGDVIFNVGGNVSTSGGLNNPGEVEIDGVVMAQGSISLTPGFVSGELISDKSINIASGGGVVGGSGVPDGASTMLLLCAGLAPLVAGHRLISRKANVAV